MEESGLAQPLSWGKKVQLDTLTVAPCSSDKPQRHEIAIQADGPSMGKLTLISMYTIIITTTRSNHRNKCSITQDVEGTVEFIASKICTI